MSIKDSNAETISLLKESASVELVADMTDVVLGM